MHKWTTELTLSYTIQRKQKNVPHHAKMIKEDETITLWKVFFSKTYSLFNSFYARIAKLVEWTFDGLKMKIKCLKVSLTLISFSF